MYLGACKSSRAPLGCDQSYSGAKFCSHGRFSWKSRILPWTGRWCKQNAWKLIKIVCWRTSVAYMTRRAAMWELIIYIVISVGRSAGRAQISWISSSRAWGVRNYCFLHPPAGTVQSEIALSPVVALRILLFATPPMRECDFWNVQTWTNSSSPNPRRKHGRHFTPPKSMKFMCAKCKPRYTLLQNHASRA